MERTPDLSLVVPVYNEEKRISVGLSGILRFLKKQTLTWELILVDDGSTDATVNLLRQKIKGLKSVRLLESQHLGKGGAIKKGVLAAQGGWILFLDIDLATPMEELNRFWPKTKSYNVLIGSRKMRGARVLVHQPKFREFSGKVFTFLTNLLVTKGISDITCGFKMFKSNIAKKIFSKSIVCDWSFDAEIIFLAQKYKAKIREIPVTWKDDPQTKVNIFKDAVKSFSGLVRIRLNSLTGKYN